MYQVIQNYILNEKNKTLLDDSMSLKTRDKNLRITVEEREDKDFDLRPKLVTRFNQNFS